MDNLTLLTMDGSKLSCNVVSDCCAEEPMGVDHVRQSFGQLELKDTLHTESFVVIPKSECRSRSDIAIDPVLTRIQKRVGTDSGYTQSICTTSLDSAYGDSITSSLRSVGSSIDTSLKLKPSSLEPLTEAVTKGLGEDCFDEGIEEDVAQTAGETVQRAVCSVKEAVPCDYPDESGTLEKNQDGDTILHLNIIFMLTQRAFEIISQVPNRDCLNIENHMMQTPLILAALTKQTKIIRRLMVAGADIEKTDRHGDTALHVACRNGDLQMVKQITTPISADEVRMYPCKYQTRVQRIPQDLNARNYDGLTPFHLATVEGHLDVMTELAHLGADVDAQEGRNGKRAIHLAVELNHESTIRHLVEECAVDIDATTFYNLSPVMLANEKRFHRVVEYLVQCGADHSDLDCSEVEEDSDASDDIEMFDDFMINGEPIQS